MPRDRGGLGHRGQSQIEALRQREHLSRGDDEDVGEATLYMGVPGGAAQIAGVQAGVASTRVALPALSAGCQRVYGHRCPRRRRLDAGTRLAYPAHDLVAEHQRFAEPELPDGSVAPVVQVGAADAAVLDVDRHLARAGHRYRALLQAEVSCAMRHHGSHRR